MKVETLLWLLPVVFMIHDFEEIIMISSWMEKNRAVILARFPKLGKRLLSQFGNLSGPGFSVAVFEEFLLISLLTFLAVENSWYNLWTGLMLVFLLHLLVHAAQFLVFRKYIPAVFTSLLGMLYCFYALTFMSRHGLIAWPETAKWFAIFAVAFAVNLAFAHRLGKLANKLLVE
jgi:hypothetical protein